MNIRGLIGKLNRTTEDALEAAAGLCLARTHYDVDIEHLLLKLLDVPGGDLEQIVSHYGVDDAALRRDLGRALERLKTGNARTPAISPRIVRLLQDAWMKASIEYGSPEVRSGHVIVALLTEPDHDRFARDLSGEFSKISRDDFGKNLIPIVGASIESRTDRKGLGKAEAGDVAAARGGGALALYTVDLTERARGGELDPVLGRDAEIRLMIDILTRRRQNNPILTGEAGVGKTAVVEGFAQRVVSGDVPEALKPVRVHVLDLGLLQAGAGIKGEFENRLKSVISEVRESEQPVILFIDEAHTMIGAGGSAGQGDAANLLKPALARGELRTIAATTWAEYKKYFEKDAALARRFQVIKVDEPSDDVARLMLRGWAESLEKHHGIRILEEAVGSAVALSRRYITGRQLPDKAVGVLDTASARVVLSQTTTPPAIEDCERSLKLLDTEEAMLERESVAGTDHSERLAAIAVRRTELLATLDTAKKQWEQERALIRETLETWDQLGRAMTEAPCEECTPPDTANSLREKLHDARRRLKDVQGENPLIHGWVDSQTIAEVVGGWTGIPVGRMMSREIEEILALSSRLEERIVGQADALRAISQRVSTSKAGLGDARRPIAVFLLVGPSGVGKTETALALADLLYGGERNIVSINMSEYQEPHTVSGLKGSPPGYVGYGEGGVLTEAVRRRPYTLVLLDEVEKAHRDVLELFYQVFDTGSLEDAEGRMIDFKNTLIILTSNVGSATITKLCADPETRPGSKALVDAIYPELVDKFTPAFLGRLITVPYLPLDRSVMSAIAKMHLERIRRRLQESHGACFDYEPGLVERVLDMCTEPSTGARNIDHILTGTVLPEISAEVLRALVAGERIRGVHVSVDESGAFVCQVA